MAQPPGLFEVVGNKIRVKHYSIRTEKAYIYWIESYLQFYSLQHPRQLNAEQIEAYLTHLAVNRKVSASTQNQALSALLFLYSGGTGNRITVSRWCNTCKKIHARAGCIYTWGSRKCDSETSAA